MEKFGGVIENRLNLKLGLKYFSEGFFIVMEKL